MAAFLQTLAADVLQFLFPPICTLCGDRLAETDQVICDRCRQELPPVREPLCRRCGAPRARAADVCPTCRKMKPAFDCARAAAVYLGPAMALVKQLKYHAHLEFAPVMARLMFLCWERMMAFETLEGIVPVPLYPARQRERGFNQADLLAEPLAALFGKPMLPDAVARVRPTRTQTALNLKERLANVEGAFEPLPGAEALVGGKEVVLVDDVCTTGATGSACAAALRKAGARRVVLLTFARAAEG